MCFIDASEEEAEIRGPCTFTDEDNCIVDYFILFNDVNIAVVVDRFRGKRLYTCVMCGMYVRAFLTFGDLKTSISRSDVAVHSLVHSLVPEQ